MKPLTKDKIIVMEKPVIGLVNYILHGTNFVSVEHLAQALELLKKQISELPNRDDWLQKDLPVAAGVLDGGGVGRIEVIELIEDCFPVFKEDNNGTTKKTE